MQFIAKSRRVPSTIQKATVPQPKATTGLPPTHPPAPKVKNPNFTVRAGRRRKRKTFRRRR